MDKHVETDAMNGKDNKPRILKDFDYFEKAYLALDTTDEEEFDKWNAEFQKYLFSKQKPTSSKEEIPNSTNETIKYLTNASSTINSNTFNENPSDNNNFSKNTGTDLRRKPANFDLRKPDKNGVQLPCNSQQKCASALHSDGQGKVTGSPDDNIAEQPTLHFTSIESLTVSNELTSMDKNAETNAMNGKDNEPKILKDFDYFEEAYLALDLKDEEEFDNWNAELNEHVFSKQKPTSSKKEIPNSTNETIKYLTNASSTINSNTFNENPSDNNNFSKNTGTDLRRELANFDLRKPDKNGVQLPCNSQQKCASALHSDGQGKVTGNPGDFVKFPLNTKRSMNQANGPSHYNRNKANGPHYCNRNQDSGPSYSNANQANGPPYYNRNQDNGPSCSNGNQANGPSYYNRNQDSGPSYSNANQANGPPYCNRNQDSGPSYSNAIQANGPPYYNRNQDNGPSCSNGNQANGPPYYNRNQDNGPSCSNGNQANGSTYYNWNQDNSSSYCNANSANGPSYFNGNQSANQGPKYSNQKQTRRGNYNHVYRRDTPYNFKRGDMNGKFDNGNGNDNNNSSANNSNNEIRYAPNSNCTNNDLLGKPQLHHGQNIFGHLYGYFVPIRNPSWCASTPIRNSSCFTSSHDSLIKVYQSCNCNKRQFSGFYINKGDEIINSPGCSITGLNTCSCISNNCNSALGSSSLQFSNVLGGNCNFNNVKSEDPNNFNDIFSSADRRIKNWSYLNSKYAPGALRFVNILKSVRNNNQIMENATPQSIASCIGLNERDCTPENLPFFLGLLRFVLQYGLNIDASEFDDTKTSLN